MKWTAMLDNGAYVTVETKQRGRDWEVSVPEWKMTCWVTRVEDEMAAVARAIGRNSARRLVSMITP